MINTRQFVSVLLLSLFVQIARAQMPEGFSWVNIESDKTTMTSVRSALHDRSITSIREVGIEGGFALVMTASRESDAPTPDYDRWTIYNISLRTGKSQVLVSGYGVKLLDWISPTNPELAITYYDCWECEAATLFTTLHFRDGSGWVVRWSNKTKDLTYPQPGAVVRMTDVGDPYDDNEVDQIFAVIKRPDGRFAVGSWMHSRNSKTGKVADAVERYSIDPATQTDRIEDLTGLAARDWEHQLCDPSNLLIQPGGGQDSKTCLAVLGTAAPRR